MILFFSGMASGCDPRVVLERHFGFDVFLDAQEEVVSSILEGRDGLVVMPTGGGKSLCYQLPAMCMEGVTLVVSPLISLMKDQVDALVEKGIPATMINSTLNAGEQRDRVQRMKGGEYRLVYVAPERFRAPVFMEALKSVNVVLFAVDEAHCLSQWGHDFRPEYMRLGKVLEELGRPQTLALTATATPVVRQDIMDVLRLDQPFETVSGFSRPNLSLAITPMDKHRQKYDRLSEVISGWRTGIIYCSTRKRVEEVAETLHGRGVKCIAYHGGMSEAERESTQNRFINREADVAVATNSFGMGIDRSDVRFVIHFEVPGSIEAYYQEVGRAGRDGEPAFCELFFNYADTRTQEFFIEGVNPGYVTICSVYRYLLSEMDDNFEVQRNLDDIADGADVRNGMAVGSALTILSRGGYVERFDIPGSRIRGTRVKQPDVLAMDLKIDREALEQKERRDREKLDAMVQLCYGRQCRQQAILEYFGESGAETCGTCDVCEDSLSGDAREPADNEEWLVVRKALSGVARMSRKTAHGWEGVFGRGRIVQMLMGSQSKEIKRVKLDQLSTHGILRSCGTNYLNELFRLLHDAGLVVTQKSDYPLITLTERGEKVMMGEVKPVMVWPKKNGHAGEAADELQVEEFDFDADLYDRLRELRNKLAKQQGLQAYQVFPNKTLEYFTRLRPQTEEAGRRIKGVGEIKASKFLSCFIEEINRSV